MMIGSLGYPRGRSARSGSALSHKYWVTLTDLFQTDYRRVRHADERKKVLTLWRQSVIATLREKDFWTTGRIRPATEGDYVVRYEPFWDRRSVTELVDLLEVLEGLRRRSKGQPRPNNFGPK